MLQAAFEKYELELQAWYATLGGYQCEMHVIPALEFQHALNHICLIFRSQGENEYCIARHVEKATGHIHRAHLDFLKIQIRSVQHGLGLFNHPAYLHSAIQQGRLRLDELNDLGKSDRAYIFDHYRSLLDELISALKNACAEKKEKWPLKAPWKKPAASPQAKKEQGNAGDRELFGDFYKHADLYWEWAELEAKVAAFTGQRIAEQIIIIVDAYYNSKLGEKLPWSIAELKQGFISQILAALERVAPDSAWRGSLQRDTEFQTAWAECCEKNAEREDADQALQEINGKIEIFDHDSEQYKDLRDQREAATERLNKAKSEWIKKTCSPFEAFERHLSNFEL